MIVEKLLNDCWIICTIKNNNTNLNDLGKREFANDKCYTEQFIDCALKTLEQFDDIVFCYAFQNELNFVFEPKTTLFNRRKKIIKINMLQSILKNINEEIYLDLDVEIYLFPTDKLVKEFIDFKQECCHNENIYNLCLWNLLKDGVAFDEAINELKNTTNADKNELLFSRFNTNYNNEYDLYKKGVLVIRNKFLNNSIKNNLNPTNNDKFSRFIGNLKSKTFWKNHGKILPNIEYYFSNTSSSEIIKSNFQLYLQTVVVENDLSKRSTLTKYEYVRKCEIPDRLLDSCWIVCCIRNYSTMNNKNPENYYKLLQDVSISILSEFNDTIFSYVTDDEQIFIFRPETQLFERRKSKILSSLVSKFTACFMYNKKKFLDSHLDNSVFTGNVYLLPSDRHLKQFLEFKHKQYISVKSEENILCRKSFLSSSFIKQCMENTKSSSIKLYRQNSITLDRFFIDNPKILPLLKYNPDRTISSLDFDDYNCSEVINSSLYNICRIDGRNFHRFTVKHEFTKPNDRQALDLMNSSAAYTISTLSPIISLGYGESDEFSFLLNCSNQNLTDCFLMTAIVSAFTSYYVSHWEMFFCQSKALLYPPEFDSRIVLYTNIQVIKDYFSWRQVDCHINNMYNTCFWNIVLREHKSEKQAENDLKCTLSVDKKEILLTRFNIKYDEEQAIFRKGSILVNRDLLKIPINEIYFSTDYNNVFIFHGDLINEEFWKVNQQYL